MASSGDAADSKPQVKEEPALSADVKSSFEGTKTTNIIILGLLHTNENIFIVLSIVIHIWPIDPPKCYMLVLKTQDSLR